MTLYELSHPFENGMPHYAAIPPFLHVFQRRLGEVVRPGGVSIAADILVASLHSGSHIDAPSHVADQDEIAVARPSGEQLPALLTRAVVLDFRAAIAAGAYELDEAHLDAAISRAGVEPGAGDVVLVSTGWAERWTDASAYAGPDADPPGLGLAAARRLADAGVVAIGADTPTVEPRSTQHAVHRDVLSRSGVYLIENLDLGALCDDGHGQALFLGLPLQIVGATGSPLRCVALTGDGVADTIAFFRSQTGAPGTGAPR